MSGEMTKNDHLMRVFEHETEALGQIKVSQLFHYV